MDIQSEKLHLIKLLTETNNINLIKQIKAMFADSVSGDVVDFDVQREMIFRANKSNEDIKFGRVHTVEEADALISKRLGL